MTRRVRQSGQASVEALALIPALVLVVAMAWQLALLVRGALVAQDSARAAAVTATGHGNVVVRRTVDVPVVVPGVGRLRIPVTAVVRAP